MRSDKERFMVQRKNEIELFILNMRSEESLLLNLFTNLDSSKQINSLFKYERRADSQSKKNTSYRISLIVSLSHLMHHTMSLSYLILHTMSLSHLIHHTMSLSYLIPFHPLFDSRKRSRRSLLCRTSELDTH
jgi:hypothetical protein